MIEFDVAEPQSGIFTPPACLQLPCKPLPMSPMSLCAQETKSSAGNNADDAVASAEKGEDDDDDDD